jgi:nucleoside-diphosphate-sugar epimerase
MNERVLVTGADGFIGRHVCRRLIESAYVANAGILDLALWPELQRAVPGLSDFSLLGDLGANQDYRTHLANVSVVVHLAARGPKTWDNAAKPSHDYMRVNAGGTKSIALAAAEAGVRRFIFVSTVKVHGEVTFERPFNEDTPANPRNPYAASKWEAEEVLRAVAADSGMEVVIVRPPQVYGPGVRGNFLRLMKLVDRGLPLPLPRRENCRSLIGAENLSDFLIHCVSHPKAANQVMLVKDTEDISTRDLITRLARAMGRRIRFLPVPAMLIRFAAKLTLKEEATGRFLDSLVIDSSRAQQMLQWVPPVTLDDGLAATALWYQEMKLPSGAKAF